MPGPRVREHAKPKKGTIKRLLKSLWKNFKLELIISLISLILSIAVNLCGSIFASLITEVLTESIKTGKNAFTDLVGVNPLNMFEDNPIPTNIKIGRAHV